MPAAKDSLGTDLKTGPWSSNMDHYVDDRKTTQVALVSPHRMRAYVVLAITIGALFVCFLLAMPFLPALAWALSLAILCVPSHRWIERKVASPSLAALVSVSWIGLVVVMPALWISARLITEAAAGAVVIKEKVASGEWRAMFESHNALATLVPWIEELDLPAAIGTAASWTAARAASFVGGWILQLVTIALTFYLLFYFLRDRKLVVAWLHEVSPLSIPDTRRLFNRIVDTVQATLYGTFAVAAIQGTLGGLVFWWLVLPTPLVWGLVMGVLAIVPVFGAFIVWVPVAIFLALEGNWASALILAAWGTLVIGAIDNFLYPVLVGDRLKLHTVPSFIAIVGGIILFGPSGLLLGPVAVATTIVLLEVWRVQVSSTSSAEGNA
jgi:predicted PurR-regulated permease PerM